MMNNSFIELPDLDSAFLAVGFLPFKNQPEGSIFSEPEDILSRKMIAASCIIQKPPLPSSPPATRF